MSQLEQAGVNENTTADIVGHDKPRITYGLYSSGASTSQKAEALAKVAYKGQLGGTWLRNMRLLQNRQRASIRVVELVLP